MTTTATRPDAGRSRAAIAAKTLRTDRWWFPPLITFVGLSAWLLYGLVRVYMHKWYLRRGLPLPDAVLLALHHRPVRAGGRALRHASCRPGGSSRRRRFTLPFLLLFRLTCYYYRKAYYRAFWLSPPACAVPDGHKKYTGETRFPLLGQNLHRYAFYAAVIISLINTYDAIIAFHSPEGFGFGLGNVILVGNVVMLWAYTVSCHSCRHIIGGRMKHFSKHPVRYRAWGVRVEAQRASTCSWPGSRSARWR